MPSKHESGNSKYIVLDNNSRMFQIPVDYCWLKDELVKLERSYEIARDTYSMAYPKIRHGYDARITVFSKCANIINSTTFGAQFMLDALLKPEWWEKTDPWAMWLSNQPKYNKAVPIREWDYFLKIGFLVGIFSNIESSFRDYYRAIITAGNPSADFRYIRNELFEQLQIDEKHSRLLALFALVRNSLHNNGIHYADWTNEPIKITYRNNDHVFRNGEVVRIEWTGALILAEDCKDMLVEIVNRKGLLSIQEIKDSAAPADLKPHDDGIV